MSLKCGIVGLPNVGKSTLFNALTQAGIAAENYPFCTIEPNTGVVEVPDPRLAQLATIVKPQKVVPAIVEFVDIAGLVAGASKGEGLGNQFLANIRETDAICHVVRCFQNDNVIHVAGKVDPLSDVETIATELALADLASAEKAVAYGRHVYDIAATTNAEVGKVAEALRGRDTDAALWGLVFIDLWYCSNFGGPLWAQLMARDPNAVGLAIQAACWVHAVSGADGGPALAALLNRHRCWEIAEQCVRCSTMRWVRDWWRRSVLPQRTQ